MAMTREQIKERMAEIRKMKIDLFMEISVNHAAEMLLANGGVTEVEGVTLESTNDECAIIGLAGNTPDIRHRVELRLNNRRAPMGRCDCEKGSERIRCEHLVKASHALAMLGKLGLTGQITKPSPYVWIPFDWQKK